MYSTSGQFSTLVGRESEKFMKSVNINQNLETTVQCLRDGIISMDASY